MDQHHNLIQPAYLQRIKRTLQLNQNSQLYNQQQQKQNYNQLTELQSQTQFYIHLAYIYNAINQNINIRQLASLVLKAALQRNMKYIGFTRNQINTIKNYYLLTPINNSILINPRNSILCLLAINHQIDYQLLTNIINSTDIHNLKCIAHLLQDLRFNSHQNINFKCDSQWQNFVSSLFSQYVHHIALNPIINAQTEQIMKIINLIIFYLPFSSISLLKDYCYGFLFPMLANQIISPNVLQTLQSIAENKPYILLQTQKFSQLCNLKASKQWANIMIQLLDNMQGYQETIRSQLPVILANLIKGMVYTLEDQRNKQVQMELQQNPDQANDVQDDRQQGYYTLRKICVQCLSKIATHFQETLWSMIKQYCNIQAYISSKQQAQQQVCLLVIGVCSQYCLQQMNDDLANMFNILIQILQSTKQSILMATCFWTLNQTIQSYSTNKIIICMQFLLRKLNQQNHNKYNTLNENLPNMAALSLLDTILSKHNLTMFSEQIKQNIYKCLLFYIQKQNNRLIFNTMKIICTIFEHCKQINEQIVQVFITEIYKKWKTYEHKDTILCPLIQCLIVICQQYKNTFKLCACEIFQQLLPLLKSDRKAVILRSIDLISSLMSIEQQKLKHQLSHSDFLNIVSNLLTHSQKQIRNFSYGMLSDLNKIKFIELIGETIDTHNVTSMNNGFMCLTDLLTTHPHLQNYVSSLISLALNQIRRDIAQILKNNFAKAVACLLQIKSNYKLEPNDFKQVSLGLCSTENNKRTDDAFKGIFTYIGSIGKQHRKLLYPHYSIMIKSFISYHTTDHTLNDMFKIIISNFRSQISQQDWQSLRSVMLPAAFNIIDKL